MNFELPFKLYQQFAHRTVRDFNSTEHRMSHFINKIEIKNVCKHINDIPISI